MRDDVLRAYPALDPDRVHVVHNGIDTELVPAATPAPTCCERTASTRTGRPSSSSAGSPGRRALPHLLRAAAQLPPDGAARALRRRAGHPRDRGRGRRRWSTELRRRPRRRRLDPRDAAARRRRRRCSPHAHGRSSARRSTSRSASSTSRRWPARPRSSPPRPAASPRSSSTARPGCWCRSSRPTDGTGTPLDPDAVRRRPRRGAHRGASPTRTRAARDGPGRAAPGGRGASPGTRSPSRTLEVYRSAALSGSGHGGCAAGGLERPAGPPCPARAATSARAAISAADTDGAPSPARASSTMAVIRSACSRVWWASGSAAPCGNAGRTARGTGPRAPRPPPAPSARRRGGTARSARVAHRRRSAAAVGVPQGQRRPRGRARPGARDQVPRVSSSTGPTGRRPSAPPRRRSPGAVTYSPAPGGRGRVAGPGAAPGRSRGQRRASASRASA